MRVGRGVAIRDGGSRAGAVSLKFARWVLPGLTQGREGRRLVPDPANIEDQRSRLEAGEAEISAVARDRVHAIRMEQRDLRTDQPNAGRVGNASDQDRRRQRNGVAMQ